MARHNLDQSTLHQELRRLAGIYAVRLYFNTQTDSLGQSRYWNRSISIQHSLTPPRALSVFFHELGHIHCYEEGKWASYHNPKPPASFTHDEKRLIVRTALRAERWVDRWARQEMRRHFPGVRYHSNYGDPRVASRFLKEIKSELCLDQ